MEAVEDGGGGDGGGVDGGSGDGGGTFGAWSKLYKSDTVILVHAALTLRQSSREVYPERRAFRCPMSTKPRAPLAPRFLLPYLIPRVYRQQGGGSSELVNLQTFANFFSKVSLLLKNAKFKVSLVRRESWREYFTPPPI